MTRKWWELAACRGLSSRDYDPFDPPETMLTPPQDAQDACGSCPVGRECLIDAIRNGDHCVRGGTTKRQRDLLVRPLTRKRCPICKNKLGLPEVEDYQVCSRCGISWRASRRPSVAPAESDPRMAAILASEGRRMALTASRDT